LLPKKHLHKASARATDASQYPGNAGVNLTSSVVCVPTQAHWRVDAIDTLQYLSTEYPMHASGNEELHDLSPLYAFEPPATQ
jgi:hypothetical protein